MKMINQWMITIVLMSALVAGLPTTLSIRDNKNATVSSKDNNNSTSSSNQDNGKPYVQVLNKCSFNIVAGTSQNGELYGKSAPVSAGGSHTFNYPSEWRGRIWGRYTSDSPKSFTFAGIGAPSTLAEFDFSPSRETFYDISLVDGSNIPMSIAPAEKTTNSFNVNKHCGTPICSKLPSCPAGFESDGVKGCKSACSKYGTDEHCCTGKYNNESVCKSSSYSAQVKSACPDAYSYAYDDATSVYTCGTAGYIVTFCP
ncbi:unnamed protein product [Cunninghamella blakesleeana]